MIRKRLTDKDKNEIGRKCANCASTLDLEYHHIIPVVIGGKDINSNMVCLCNKCHRLLHGVYKNEYIDHSELIKKGIQKAKKNGVTIGRPKTTPYNIPEKFYQFYPLYQEHKISISKFAKLTGFSRMTIYRYLAIIVTD